MPKNPWEMTPEEMAAATKPKANATKNPWEMSEAEMANATKLAGPAPEAQPDITPDEFGDFIQTGKLPAGRKTVKELRSMPRGLIQSPEDLATAYGVDPAGLAQNDLLSAFQEFKAGENKGKSSGVLDTFMQAIKKGAVDPARGVEQAVSRGFANLIPSSPMLQSSANLSDLQARVNADQYSRQNEANPIASTLGQGIGQAPYALLTPTAPILGAASKAPGALKAAAGGAAFGFSQPITDPEQSRTTNTLLGAAMAPAAQFGIEGGVTALSKLRAALPGGKLPAQYDALQKEIRAAGMEPTAADLTDDPTSWLVRRRDAIANSPIGNFAEQNKQNKIAAKQMLDNMLSGTRQKTLGQPITGLDTLEGLAKRTPERAPNPEAVRALGNLGDYSTGSNQAAAGSVMQADMLGNKYNLAAGVKDLYAPAEAVMPNTNINLEGPLAEAQRILGRLQTSGELGADTALARDLQKAIADLTPEKPLDSLGINQNAGQAPVLTYPGKQAQVGGADHLGIIDNGRAPVVGGGLAQPEERDIYGTVIKNAAGGASPDGLPPKAVTQQTTPGGFGLGPIAPPSQSSGMPHTPGAVDRFVKTLRELRDTAYESGRRGAGDAYKSLIEKTELARNTDPAMADYLAKKFAADESMGAGIGMFNSGGGTNNVSDKTINGLMEMAPDKVVSRLKALSPVQTKELGKTYGPAGKSAHFHMLVDDIVTGSATNRTTPGFQFQRGEFLDKLNKMKGQIGEVASPLEKSQIDSIERVMQHMDQLDKTDYVAPNYTKMIWSQPQIVLRPLLTTDWGKRMLLTLSASKVGSATERSVLQAIEQKIPQFLAMGQDHNGGNPINDIPVEPIE